MAHVPIRTLWEARYMTTRETIPDQLAYSDAQAAALVGVSRPTLRKFLDSGELLSFRMGKRRVIARTELEDFINRRMAVAS